jgi:NAD(P)H-dependent flavin oxidoreductase YrpB (nitropropane dioxygenase family)
MSSPEKSSESIAYLPGASANGSEPVQTEAVEPPIVQAPPALSEPAAVEAQARFEALERQLAEIMADRDDLREQRDKLRDEVLELPEELAAISNSRAFKIMKAGPLLAMRQPLSTLLVVSSMGLLTNLWTFTPVATSLYIGVGAVVLVVSALQFWASHD